MFLYATGATTLAKLAKRNNTNKSFKNEFRQLTAPEWTTANAPTAGGTGQTTWATGDLLYANGSNTLTKLTKPGSTIRLQMTSGWTSPSWAAAAPSSDDVNLATETANVSGSDLSI